MRIWVGSAALLLVLAAGCNLPQRRPEALLYVSHCAADVGVSDFAPGSNLVGSEVPHRDCVRLDARASSTFTGGVARYVWTVAYTYPTQPAGVTLPSTVPAAGTLVTLVSTNGAFSEGTFFSHVAVDQTQAELHLTVIDSAGRTREASSTLLLRDTPPTLGAREIVQPRVFGFYIDPFMVVEPQIADADVPSAADGYVARRAADLADETRVDVQQADVPTGKPFLQQFRCAELPTRLGLPDPSNGNPLAWCFSIDPIDDPSTPVHEQYCPTAGAGCYDSLVRGHPDDEAVQVRLLMNVVEPWGSSHAMPADCSAASADARSGCVTVVLEDEVWTASGIGNFNQGAMVGRIAPDWQRSPANTIVDARDGVGVATDAKGQRRWFAGSDPLLCGLELQTAQNCGALLGVDANLSRSTIDGFGPIAGVDPDGADGIWVAAQSVGTAQNPTSQSSDRTPIPAGQTYVAYLSSADLFATSGGSVTTMPTSSLGLLTGLRHAVAAASTEIPMQMLRVGGEIVMTTAEQCDHLRPASASGPATCSANATLPPGVGPYRLRELTVPPGTPFGAIDLDASGPAGVTLGLSGQGGPDHLVARAGAGRIWIVRTTPSNPYENTWQVELHDLPYVDDQTDAVVPLPGGAYPLSVAYDASSDELWVSDVETGEVLWFSAASQSSLAAPAAPNAVLPPFTFPLELAVDANGGVWVDDHLDDLHRRAGYIDPTSRQVTLLDDYVSAGIGLEPASRALNDRHTAIWRADATNVVREAADNPAEIPTLAYPSVFSALGGVDPIDGAAYVYSIETGANLFRVDVDGTVTSFVSGGRIEAGAMVPTLLVTTNQTSATSSMMMLAVFESNGATSFVGALNVDRLREASGTTSAVQDCPLADPFGAEIAEPCWMRLDGATARIPLVLGSTPVAAEQMRVSMEFTAQHIALRAYVLAMDGTGGQYLASIAPISYPPSAAGPSAIEAYTQLAGGALPASVPQPISSFTMATPAAILDGVWLVRADGAAQRWHVSGTSIVPDPGLVISFSGLTAQAVATNPFDFGFATFRPNAGGATLLSWGFLDDSSGSPAIVPLGIQPINGEGGALVSSDFSNIAWVTGNDGTLERWRVVVDTAAGLTQIRPEYVRPAESSDGPTPAGWSIKAGSF